MKPEVLKFENLDPYLLLKNGNFLYKVPFRDGWAVLKVYYGSRGVLGRIHKSCVNVLLYGQTSYMPKTRCRTERDCIHVWRSHGFRVFDLYEDVVVEAPGCVPGGYSLFEYVDAPQLVDYLQDESRSLEDRFVVFRRFLREWGNRHEVAIREKDPRLIHENGDGKHVLVLEGGGLLWFDFEMVYRHASRVSDLVSHEIVQFLWFLQKVLGPDLSERVLDETINTYPDRCRLLAAHRYFFRHPNLVHRTGRALDRRFRKRARKPTSKYRVALQLKGRLEQASR